MLDFMYKGEYEDGARHILDDGDGLAEGTWEILDPFLYLDSNLSKYGYLVEKKFNDLPAASSDVEDRETADDASTTAQLEVTNSTMMKDMILRNMRVNSIADYYDIPSLKRCANTKIEGIIKATGIGDSWPEVVREAIQSTSDNALHRMLALTSAEHIEELIELEDFTALEVMNDFAVTIIRSRLVAHDKKEQDLNRIVQALESELRSTKAMLRTSNR